MGGSYVGNAATFLIETLIGLYILIVMLRFLLQWARADFYNPVSQFIVKVTQPRREFPVPIDASVMVIIVASGK